MRRASLRTRFMQSIFNTVEQMIRQQLIGQPILHKEVRDDQSGYDVAVVYMHSIRQEREGYRCRFFIIAYTHRPGDKPLGRFTRAYIMEYPLIKKYGPMRALEYTAPELDAEWKPN